MRAKSNGALYFVKPDAFATTLTVIAADALVWEEASTDEELANSGLSALTRWHPETVQWEVSQELGLKPDQVPSQNWDKLNTAIGILTSDDFFRRADRFIDYCNILSGQGEFRPDLFDHADADECAWGITEALLLRAPLETPEPFSNEIRYYIGAALQREGIKQPPDVLKLALFPDDPGWDAMGPDDPEMFSGWFQLQRESSEEVETFLRDRLTALLQELSQLKLRHGNTDDLMQRVGKMMATEGLVGKPDEEEDWATRY